MEQQMFNVESTFGLKGAKVEVPGFKPGHPHMDFVPKVDDKYLHRREIFRDLLAWWKFGGTTPLYVVGPMGAGKTSGLFQVAAKLNVPVQYLVCHSRMETPELIGRHVLVDGDMVFVDGPLVTAMRHGHMLILDEIDLLDPSTAAGLNGLREGLPITIPETGEVVHAHPNFRWAATANTNGGGDETGLYQGTNRLNGAFLDGFWGLQVGYPDKEHERAIVQSAVPELEVPYIDRMISVANDVRKVFMGESDKDEAIELTMSTRTLVRWARMQVVFAGVAQHGESPNRYALERALTWRATPETKAFIEGIVQREFEGAA